jgi:NAD(P)-dependent dehydrogenase (short-subunit alcohol dehydrogenase family)
MSNNPFSLKDKVVVITGGTGILGEAFVEALAEAEARVAILGRNQQIGAERVQQVEYLGGGGHICRSRYYGRAGCRQGQRDEILEKWGRIDGLVNAVGGNIPGATIGADQDLFASNIQDTIKAIELNLYGTIIPTHIIGSCNSRKRKRSDC